AVPMQGKLRVGAHRLNKTTLDRNRLCPGVLVVAGKNVPVQQQHVARAQGVTPDKYERESAKAALPKSCVCVHVLRHQILEHPLRFFARSWATGVKVPPEVGNPVETLGYAAGVTVRLVRCRQHESL